MRFIPNDRVICVDNKNLNDFLTLGKVYKVYTSVSDGTIEVLDDKLNRHYLKEDRFRKLLTDLD